MQEILIPEKRTFLSILNILKLFFFLTFVAGQICSA